MNRKNVIRTITAIAVVVLLGWSFFYFSDDTRGYKPVDTSVAVAQINGDNVKSAQIDDREQQLRLTLKKGNGDTDNSDKVITKYPSGYAVDLFNALSAKNAKVSTVVNQGSILGELLVYVLPLLLLVGLFVMFSRMQGGARMGFGFGKSRAKLLNKDMPKTTFADVAGVDEAVEELYEIKDFLQNPGRYQALGAKIPKGCCSTAHPEPVRRCWPAPWRGGRGPVLHHLRLRLRRDVRRCGRLPGARPVRAGQAEQPLHHLRRRDRRGGPPARRRPRRWARRARANAEPVAGRDGRFRPARRRHPDRGHQPARHPGPRAAAARPLRPSDPGVQPGPGGSPRGAGGAFQGQAHRPGRRPQRAGQAHRRHDRCRPGQRHQRGGAADRPGERHRHHHRRARRGGGPGDRRPRRKGRIISEQEKKITAYHEGGHTLAAWAMPDIEPIYKVTILARGRTGGHAVAVPEEDKACGPARR